MISKMKRIMTVEEISHHRISLMLVILHLKLLVRYRCWCLSEVFVRDIIVKIRDILVEISESSV